MRIPRHLLLFCAITALPLALAARWRSGAGRSQITIATWNLEWLVSPSTAHAGRIACRHDHRAPLPCDVVERVSRDSADIGRLASYVRALDADIVAFQEVENEAIARRIFNGYNICMADGSGVQHVGFAVRPHVNHQCGPMVEALAAGGRSRKAMSMQWNPEHGAPVQLLAVHLKSGCSREPLDSDVAACRLLADQALQLGQWIADRSAEQADFIVLGDFNRVPPQSDGDEFWQRVRTAPLELLADSLPFANCYAGQPYLAFIDHMLLSSTMAKRLVSGRSHHVGFSNADAVRYRLSDHCPVSISLSVASNTAPREELSSVAR